MSDKTIRLGLLVVDDREIRKQYHLDQPFFGTAPAALLEGFEALGNIEVHLVSVIRKPMAMPEKIGARTWYHAVEVPKIGWLTTGYQGCIRAVRKKLREIGPDIVHGQGTERDCAMEAVFSGYPNVVTIHGNMRELSRLYKSPPFSYHWWTAHLEDLALRRTCGVFCNSGYTEGLVSPRTRKTWRVPNPLRSLFFSSPPVASPHFTVPTIVNVGVICPRKRQVEILDLARRLHMEGEKVLFSFVGALPENNSYSDTFRTRIAEAERDGYARYLGVLTTKELVAVFDTAHALLHFPVEEAFGLVVAEGMARNLKFFGSATGGQIDIAEGAEGAELYTPDDWASLHSGIIRWLRQGTPKPRQAAAEMARRYDPKIVAERHLEIYREVLQCSSPF